MLAQKVMPDSVSLFREIRQGAMTASLPRQRKKLIQLAQLGCYQQSQFTA